MRRFLAYIRDHEPRAVTFWVLLTLGLGVVGLRGYPDGAPFDLSDLLYQSATSAQRVSSRTA